MQTGKGLDPRLKVKKMIQITVQKKNICRKLNLNDSYLARSPIFE